jgi:hypothetical protein
MALARDPQDCRIAQQSHFGLTARCTLTRYSGLFLLALALFCPGGTSDNTPTLQRLPLPTSLIDPVGVTADFADVADTA